MITIDEAFRKFKSRLELNQREQDNASARHTEVRDFIVTKFAIADHFLTGSYKRHTKTKPLKDIDIFFVLKESERTKYRDKSPSVVLADFKKALAGKYGDKAVREQDRSINVDFGVVVDSDDNTDYRILSVDVVPAFASGNDYEIPDTSTGKWIKTNPKIHADKATVAHQAFSSEWKGLVRMVKYWNNNPKHGDQKPVKPSFLIEVMALECLQAPWGGSFEREIQAFFATLAARIHDQWPDPAGLGPPISNGMDDGRKDRARLLLKAAEREASTAIQLARQGRNGEALKAWRALLVRAFRFPEIAHMANQVAARLKGDDYQHLYAWRHALGLLKSDPELLAVHIEDAHAGSCDDVTLHYAPVTGRASRFVQVKYHVDDRNSYSTEVLLERKTGSSLLQKFYRTWQTVRATGKDPVLCLFSNWSWDSNDKIGECISGHDGSLTEKFLVDPPGSDIGKLRARWINACRASDEDFRAFARALRFLLGSTNAQEQVAEPTIERMQHLGLRHDEGALLLASGAIRDWIKRGVQKLTRDLLEEAITRLGLRMAASERTVTVYMDTIKSRRADLAPDYHLDWRDFFSGPELEKGHTPIDPTIWNRVLLPQLHSLEAQINREQTPRLIRARGLSRLSAWFAFGKVFSRVANYEIEVKQGSALWRTDATPSADFGLVTTRAPAPGKKVSELAVGLSITGSLTSDLDRYLATTGFAGEVLLLQPAHGPSRDVFRNASDVTAFVQQAKVAMRQAIQDTGASDVLLFYFGPLSGACFLGHDLNALGASVMIYEDQQPGYAPSFALGK